MSTIIGQCQEIRQICGRCMSIGMFFRAGCIERGNGEETSKDPRMEGRMGVEMKERSKRKGCEKEKSSTVQMLWKNVRKINTREKTDGIERVDEKMSVIYMP